jgi:alkylation response protein AidB-like acyl-CoA dehydrogenase
MDYYLSDAQQAILRMAATLGAGLAPSDGSEAALRKAWLSFAEGGIQGLIHPDNEQEADPLSVALALEGLGYGCADSGLVFSLAAQMLSVQAPIAAFGNEAQRDAYLPGLRDGSLIGAHAMTESESGSDAFSLRTTATRRGDTYVLNGEKVLITSAPVADVFLAFATVNKNDGFLGITAFIVERGTPGLATTGPTRKIGLHSALMGTVSFTDCEVPVARRLGAEGAGYRIFNHSMGWERGLIMAQYVGAMQRQLEQCVAAVSSESEPERRDGRRPITADMKVRLELARQFLYRAALSLQNHGKAGSQTAMAKLAISESWAANCQDAARLLPPGERERAEQDVLDSIGPLIYSGTSDIQRNLIAQGL